jgi:hypothetical protein
VCIQPIREPALKGLVYVNFITANHVLLYR